MPRCHAPLCQAIIAPPIAGICPTCGMVQAPPPVLPALNIIPPGVIPGGRTIAAGNIIPTVCNIANLITAMMAGIPLQNYHQYAFARYALAGVAFPPGCDPVQVIRVHLLGAHVSAWGQSPFDIYVVAAIALGLFGGAPGSAAVRATLGLGNK